MSSTAFKIFIFVVFALSMMGYILIPKNTKFTIEQSGYYFISFRNSRPDYYISRNEKSGVDESAGNSSFSLNDIKFSCSNNFLISNISEWSKIQIFLFNKNKFNRKVLIDNKAYTMKEFFVTDNDALKYEIIMPYLNTSCEYIIDKKMSLLPFCSLQHDSEICLITDLPNHSYTFKSKLTIHIKK